MFDEDDLAGTAGGVVMLDWQDGKIVGVEALDGSRRLHRDLLAQAEKQRTSIRNPAGRQNPRVRENLPAAALTYIRDRHHEGAGNLRGYCGRCGAEWSCRIHVAASSIVSDVAAAWWERRSSATSREERLRREHEPNVAGEVVDEAIESAPAPAVALLCYVAEVVPPGQSPRAVGGPLEDLLASHAPRLRSPEGDDVVEAIDEAARRSPQFRDALRAVYFGEDIPSEVMARLGRFLVE